jgi:hypothetical protein
MGSMDGSPGSPVAPRWIVGRGFDLSWFFGGAALGVLVLGLHFGARVPIVILFWVWVLAFDGPHIGAAMTRTFLDRQAWVRRRGLLLTSLLAFAAGPLCLGLNLATGSPRPFLLFLGLTALASYYHAVRQHYGFLALYKARNGDVDPTDRWIDRTVLYVACWAPYAFFLMTQPRARALVYLPAGGSSSGWGQGAAGLCFGAWAVTVLFFLVRLVVRPRSASRRPQVGYLLVTTLLYAGSYFILPRVEPVPSGSSEPGLEFMIPSILLGLFHSLQYLGLVWFHNRNRYRAGGDLGTAGGLGRSLGLYLAVCLAFSAGVYLLVAASTGAYPGFRFGLAARWGPISLNQLGFCLWSGLALNHYYLDQKIWRIRGDAELKQNLGLA